MSATLISGWNLVSSLGTKNNITYYHTSECLSVNNLNFYPYKIK